MLEGKLFWSAVTCHRFGAWRPAAMLPQCSTCPRVSLYLVAATGRTHSKNVRGMSDEIHT